MHLPGLRVSAVLAAVVVLGQSAYGQAPSTKVAPTVLRIEMTMWDGGDALPSALDVVVVGKIEEIEPDAVSVKPFSGARKGVTVSYTVANLKVEDRVLGATGVTRLRIGFRADRRETPTIGAEECFSLARHPFGDFYVLVATPLRKSDDKYPGELRRLKRFAVIISDPEAALKAKDLKDRFEAAEYLLYRYLTPRGSTDRVPIPEAENKLILAVLAELPWNAPPDSPARLRRGPPLQRSTLWYMANAGESGFKRPERPKQKPGDPPVDFDKLMDEATTKFLKENADQFKIKRFLQK